MDSSCLEQRRAFLVRLLALGAVGVTGGLGASCTTLGALRQGVNHASGTVTVDGQPVGEGTLVSPSSLLVTGPESQVTLVIGQDAFLVRPNSRVRFLSGDQAARPLLFAQASHSGEASRSDVTPAPVTVSARQPGGLAGFFLEAGRVLSVFAQGNRQLRTPVATLGIRGTGVYLEVQPEKTYACACYGEVAIRALGGRGEMGQTETVAATHHNHPRLISAPHGRGRIDPAPMLNHTDAELILLEKLVGRQPPFLNGYSSHEVY